MGWFIGGLVAMMMLGSILWVRPTAGDRRRMEMRQKAMQLGLQVRIEHLEVPGENRPRQLVAYTLRRNNEQIERFDPAREHWTLFKKDTAFLDEAIGEWSWLVRPKVLPQVSAETLNSLPDSAQGFGSSKEGVTVYWEESGDAAEVDRLAELLKQGMTA